MLIDRTDGMPLVNPTFYITSMVYLPGLELNTQKQVLSAIQFLYEWSKRNRIDLEERFGLGHFLELREIEKVCVDIRMDFRNYCFDPLAFAGASRPMQRTKTIVRLHRPRKPRYLNNMYNCGATTSIKLSYIKNYLDWLAAETIGRSSAREPEFSSMQTSRAEMVKWLTERIPSAGESPLKRGLTPEARTRLLDVIDPKHPDNPFKSAFVRERNRLIILYLDRLGIRRAEALLIKLGKFLNVFPSAGCQEGSVEIREHVNDPEDTRRNRPQLKTAERPLPIGMELCSLTRDFINLYRSKIPRARCHGYLFVSRSGEPLTLSSLDDIFAKVRTVEGIPDLISAHLLRYTWNDRFSEFADQMIKSGEWKSKDEEEIRRLQQGWSPDSKMPGKYSRRFLENKTRQVSIHLQENLYTVKIPDLTPEK